MKEHATKSWVVDPLNEVVYHLYGESEHQPTRLRHLMTREPEISQPLIILGQSLLKIGEEGGVLDSRQLLLLFNAVLDVYHQTGSDQSQLLAKLFVDIVTNGEHDLVVPNKHIMAHTASRKAADDARYLIDVALLTTRNNAAVCSSMLSGNSESVHAVLDIEKEKRGILEEMRKHAQTPEGRSELLIPYDERRWAMTMMLNNSLNRISEHGGVLNETVFQIMAAYSTRLRSSGHEDGSRQMDLVYRELVRQDLIITPSVSSHGRVYPRT
ncbi:MAG: hypothetical protein EB060_02110 [Proteobacteria bacterium]|nr:hypothetical protein [Pseudomonadota bacterium]